MRYLLNMLVVLAPAAAQDPESPIERFSHLDFRRQAAIVRTVERQLAALADPAIQRVLALRMETDDLPDAPAQAPIHDPRTWAAEEHAAGRAPARSIVDEDDPRHVAVRSRFPRVPFLEDLCVEVRYDWQSGRVVKLAPLEYRERFANWMHGYPPAADHAVASILSRLDRDPYQRKLSAWFGHTYCDLEARAFAGVTLYDAWFSGEQIDVPDVDAIPFAWEVLDKRGMRSPLSGAPRDALYEAIRAAALQNRRYRTTLEAAAAAFVAAEPPLAADYGRLVPRFHLLWVRNHDDPEALATVLGGAERDQLLREADDAVRAPDGEAVTQRTQRHDELSGMAETVRNTALNALERFGSDH